MQALKRPATLPAVPPISPLESRRLPSIDMPVQHDIISTMDTSFAAIEKRLAAFRQRGADLELALTPQRLASYRVLASDDSHPTAEEMLRHLKPNQPSLSLGTVYPTVELDVSLTVPTFTLQ